VPREPVERPPQRAEQCIHRRDQLDVVARRGGEQGARLVPAGDVRPGPPQLLRGDRELPPRQAAGDSLHGVVDRVREVFARVDRPPAGEELHPEHEQYEDDVHDRGRGPVEVVVVGGDELADLVDEQPEPDPAGQCRRRPHHRADEAEQQEDRHQHQQPAPQHVRDVQPAAADLRVAEQPQQRPHEEHRRDGRHHERGQVLDRLDVADQPGPHQVGVGPHSNGR